MDKEQQIVKGKQCGTKGEGEDSEREGERDRRSGRELGQD